MPTTIPEGPSTIELMVKKFHAATVVDYQYLQSMRMRVDESPDIYGLRVMVETSLCGEVLDKQTLRHVAPDWRSQLRAALAGYCRQQAVRWPLLSRFWLHRAEKFDERVRYETHTFEVRREYLDVVAREGERTKVIAYFDDQPLLGSLSEARERFMRAYNGVLNISRSSPYAVPEALPQALTELLEAAEYINWREFGNR